jgi:hypothetical protein
VSCYKEEGSVAKEQKEGKAVRTVLEISVNAKQLYKLLEAGKLLLKGARESPDIRLLMSEPIEDEVQDYEDLADLAQEMSEDLEEVTAGSDDDEEDEDEEEEEEEEEDEEPEKEGTPNVKAE